MKAGSSDSPAAEISCDVIAWASARASADEVPGLRKIPATQSGIALANGLLRHVDEQTLVGVAAVLEAIRVSGMDATGFGRWSVLAAPRFLGRAKFEAAFPQYRNEGAWGVSPHLVPSHSLHSPSGTISQVLQAHGPNLGIGGTPGGERDALLVAATWLEAGWAEGIWLVLTSRDPGSTGKVALSEPGDYRGLSLALVGSRVDHAGPKIGISPAGLRITADSADQLASLGLDDWIAPVERPIVRDGKTWKPQLGHGSPFQAPSERNPQTQERL